MDVDMPRRHRRPFDHGQARGWPGGGKQHVGWKLWRVRRRGDQRNVEIQIEAGRSSDAHMRHERGENGEHATAKPLMCGRV